MAGNVPYRDEWSAYECFVTGALEWQLAAAALCLRPAHPSCASSACIQSLPLPPHALLPSPSLQVLEMGANPATQDDSFLARTEGLKAARPGLQLHWRSGDDQGPPPSGL